MPEFYSSAKLILMGEYAVMHGADALCIPLKTGQLMKAAATNDGKIRWCWTYNSTLLADITLLSGNLGSSDDTKDVSWIVSVIESIRKIKPHFIESGATIEFTNYFPPTWGLGTSSATISSLCRWAEVDPFVVNHQVTGGSGFDIAATTASGWFLYRKAQPNPIAWQLPLKYHFSDSTWFIYSGEKQATANHLSQISANKPKSNLDWMKANDFVYRFIASVTLPELSQAINDHELLISGATGIPCISSQFPNFPGTLKSLGAWGGDFFMALSNQKEEFIREYFTSRGYKTILSWDEMVNNRRF